MPLEGQFWIWRIEMNWIWCFYHKSVFPFIMPSLDDRCVSGSLSTTWHGMPLGILRPFCTSGLFSRWKVRTQRPFGVQFGLIFVRKSQFPAPDQTEKAKLSSVFLINHRKTEIYFQFQTPANQAAQINANRMDGSQSEPKRPHTNIDGQISY